MIPYQNTLFGYTCKYHIFKIYKVQFIGSGVRAWKYLLETTFQMSTMVSYSILENRPQGKSTQWLLGKVLSLFSLLFIKKDAEKEITSLYTILCSCKRKSWQKQQQPSGVQEVTRLNTWLSCWNELKTAHLLNLIPSEVINVSMV